MKPAFHFVMMPRFRTPHAGMASMGGRGGFMREYTVVVHPDETGGYWTEVAALPGCGSLGETVKEDHVSPRTPICILRNPRQIASSQRRAGRSAATAAGATESPLGNAISEIASFVSQVEEREAAQRCLDDIALAGRHDGAVQAGAGEVAGRVHADDASKVDAVHVSAG